MMLSLAALLLAAAPPAASDVTVRAPGRLICRGQVRTATRMRTNRVCRTHQDWRAEEERPTAGSYDNIEDAVARAVGVFERNVEWDGRGGHNGPLGPR